MMMGMIDVIDFFMEVSQILDGRRWREMNGTRNN